MTAADIKKRVLSIYSKSGGKNGKHGWVAQVTSIASASNLAVQLFQPMFRHQFRIQHTNISNSLVIKRYALLQSANFLFKFSTAPKISETFLQLMDLDYDWYRKFHSLRQNIASAIKVKGRKSIDEDRSDADDD